MDERQRKEEEEKKRKERKRKKTKGEWSQFSVKPRGGEF